MCMEPPDCMPRGQAWLGMLVAKDHKFMRFPCIRFEQITKCLRCKIGMKGVLMEHCAAIEGQQLARFDKELGHSPQRYLRIMAATK